MEPDEIADELFSMAGNAGQESILSNAMDGWLDWAYGCMDREGPPNYNEMIAALGLGDDAYQATIEIWDEGYSALVSAWEDQQKDDMITNLFPGSAGLGQAIANFFGADRSEGMEASSFSD